MNNTDLPQGYRWANENELECWSLGQIERIKGAIWVRRSRDSQGNRYLNGESDMAMPLYG